MPFSLLKTERCAEEMRSVSKGRFDYAEPEWCAHIRNALRCVRIGKIALVAVMICAALSALATDLEDFYFRHDFSSGAVEASFGASSTLKKDPLTGYAAQSVYGQDGAGTAVHPGNPWVNCFGSDNESSYINSDWSVAASVRCAPVEGGVVFCIGGLSTASGGRKLVALCSSATDGKLYLKVLKRNGNTRSVEGNVEATVAGTLNGYHAVVLVYKAAGTGKGELTLYFDGAQAAVLEATTSTPFGNGFQYASLLSSNDSQHSVAGCAKTVGNTALAFQDVRVFLCTLTAEDAAAYAALYPATLPEFSSLDACAYVRSYGANGVDTGVYMTDTDKFTADFAFTDVSYKQWLCGAGRNDHNQAHGIYLNTNKELSWTNRGEWWYCWWPGSTIKGTAILDTRLRVTINPSLKASVLYYDSRQTRESNASGNTATATGPSDVPTYLFRGSGTIMDNTGQASSAKIYSFEVDATASATVPRAFFAPAQDANGAAGFIDVVAGTFHGECMGSPENALSFTPGIGQASDYRYRSGKFYSRIYAVSSDPEKGLVKFEGGEAAGTNAQFTARGKTAKIIAVLPEGGTPQVQWSGDTWAITGGTIYDSEITVKSDIAIRLVATIYKEAPVWKNNDGTGSLDNAGNWTRTPEDGESVVLELFGDTAVTCAEAKTFGKITVTGAYSADFSGAATVSCLSVELDSVTNLVTGGKLNFAAINLPAACTMTMTGAEGLGDGGLTGSGTLIIDPGAGNTYTMSKGNSGFTGEVVVKSGTARFGDVMSFGPPGRTASIRVKSGATLDEGTAIKYWPSVSIALSKAILEEGAVLQANEGYTGDTAEALQSSVLTTLDLEGDATVDTSHGTVTLAQRYHYNPVFINLGEHTLAVSGDKTFSVSRATISGTGTIDILQGATVMSTQSYYGNNSTTIADGTLRIREGGKWHLAYYFNNGIAHLSVKDLVLDGSVTREKDTFTLTVTGSITGNGTTSMLKMGAGAVFKPTGTGYLTITESLSGTMTIDPSGLDLSGGRAIPLFKTGRAEMLPAANEIVFAPGFDKHGWRLRKTRDGLGYDLARTGFAIRVR